MTSSAQLIYNVLEQFRTSVVRCRPPPSWLNVHAAYAQGGALHIGTVKAAHTVLVQQHPDNEMLSLHQITHKWSTPHHHNVSSRQCLAVTSHRE